MVKWISLPIVKIYIYFFLEFHLRLCLCVRICSSFHPSLQSTKRFLFLFYDTSEWVCSSFDFLFLIFRFYCCCVYKRFLTATRFSSCILENFWSLHIFIDNFHPPTSHRNSCCVSFLFVNLKEKRQILWVDLSFWIQSGFKHPQVVSLSERAR